MMKLKARFIPLIALGVLLAFLLRGLALDPKKLPTALIDKPTPELQLPDLLNAKSTVSQKDFQHHISLLNVWASWCENCRVEQSQLMKLKKLPVKIYGLNYKDQPEAARAWLEKYGNPYEKVASDAQGFTAINWGVYGTPELFIIDQHGRIRGKFVGTLTEPIVTEQIIPMIHQLAQGD